jgi:ribosomal protein L25 (general stress protein Ctc)
VAVAIGAKEFDEKLAHLEGSHLIRLVNDGGKDAELHDKAVLLREVQRHPDHRLRSSTSTCSRSRSPSG